MMSAARFKTLFDQQSSVTQKVYAAVPISDEWGLHQIVTELTRQGFTHEKRTVLGCLQTLARTGLVIERSTGFKRAPIREQASAPKGVTEGGDQQQHNQKEREGKMPRPSAASPIDTLSEIATKAREISRSMTEFAGLVESAALEIEGQFEQQNADSQKLKQLQALLKGL